MNISVWTQLSGLDICAAFRGECEGCVTVSSEVCQPSLTLTVFARASRTPRAVDPPPPCPEPEHCCLISIQNTLGVNVEFGNEYAAAVLCIRRAIWNLAERTERAGKLNPTATRSGALLPWAWRAAWPSVPCAAARCVVSALAFHLVPIHARYLRISDVHLYSSQYSVDRQRHTVGSMYAAHLFVFVWATRRHPPWVEGVGRSPSPGLQ